MPQQNLVFLFGPPAVGKMTVGRALEAVTGIPLFHNHMSIELVLPFFGFESPSFNRLVSGFREQLFAEVAEHGQSGMIFTHVWAFDIPSDLEFAVRAKHVFESHGRALCSWSFGRIWIREWHGAPRLYGWLRSPRSATWPRHVAGSRSLIGVTA